MEQKGDGCTPQQPLPSAVSQPAQAGAAAEARTLVHGAWLGSAAVSPQVTRRALPVEIAIGQSPAIRTSDVKQAVAQRLAGLRAFSAGPIAVPDLAPTVRDVRIDLGSAEGAVPFWLADVHMHVYRLSDEAPVEEVTDDEDGAASACQHWTLPSAEFMGLWESLVLDPQIKQHLVDFAATSMLFADSKVDPNLVSCNRIVLLHGPPGTGKTSLCKALAHKLAVRLSHRYRGAALLEINAHSLFSKWFSESGKLVMKLFGYILDLVEDEDTFVCVLIDEVESLSAARSAAMAGTEPSDAIRVVNALLTQLDRLKTHENVLILTTSNITGAIDVAFVDRADIKQCAAAQRRSGAGLKGPPVSPRPRRFIGLPRVGARYAILASCVNELGRRGLLTDGAPLPESPPTGSLSAEQALVMRAAELAEGLSGRALRKLPFQAYATRIGAHARGVPCAKYCEALCLAVEAEHRRREDVQGGGQRGKPSPRE